MKDFFALAVLIVCAVAVLKLYNAKMPGASAPKRTPQEVRALLDSGAAVTLLDVRTEDEFAAGHIPGAVCLPVDALSVRAAAMLPDKEAEILVYCQSGRRSAAAAARLLKLGYTNVSDFGGIQDWPYDITAD